MKYFFSYRYACRYTKPIGKLIYIVNFILGSQFMKHYYNGNYIFFIKLSRKSLTPGGKCL